MASMTNPLQDEQSSTPGSAGQPGTAPPERVAEVTSSVGKQAGEATAAVAAGLNAAGGSARAHGPRGGMAGGASGAAADSPENTGRCLRAEGLTGIAEGLTSLVRRHPIPAVLVGVGLGFLISRAAARWS